MNENNKNDFNENFQEKRAEDKSTVNKSTIKFTDWKNEPTVTALNEDYISASASRDTQIDKIQRWLDYLNITGSVKREKVKGRSNLIPKLIRKQAEWRYSSLSEPFLDNMDMFDIMPVTYEDVEAAKQNKLILNNQFNTKIKKTKFIDEYVRTVVDEGTVVVRIGWEFVEKKVMMPVFEIRPTDSPEVMEQLQTIQLRLQTDPNYLASLNPEIQDAFDLTLQTGIPHEVFEVGEQEELKIVKNNPTLEIVNFNNITIDPSAKGDMDNAKFIIHTFESSIAELKEDGKYKNIDSIDIEGNSTVASETYNNSDDSSFSFSDKTRKKFTVNEYWGFWDIHGDGTLEPIVAAYVGNTLIRMELNPYPDKKLPFVAVQYLPVRKSMYGEPDAELLKENQDIIGAVSRGMIDIMARSANGQIGMAKNTLDFVNRRKFEAGKDYEYNPNSDPRKDIYTHTYPEIPRSAEVMLTLQNADAESLTGIRPFAQSTTGNIGSGTAIGVRSAMDASTRRETGILRRLSEGILEIGRKIIAMNAVFLDSKEVVRITNNEFVTIRRDDLAGEFDLRLSISTAESDAAKAEELSFMLQTTGQTMGPKFIQLILSEIATLRKMPALAKKIEEYQPQPDPMAQRKAELELKLLEAQIYNEQAKGNENNANAAFDNARAQNLSSDTDLKNLGYITKESGLEHARNLELQSEQARGNMALEDAKHRNRLTEKVVDANIQQQANPGTTKSSA